VSALGGTSQSISAHRAEGGHTLETLDRGAAGIAVNRDPHRATYVLRQKVDRGRVKLASGYFRKDCIY